MAHLFFLRAYRHTIHTVLHTEKKSMLSLTAFILQILFPKLNYSTYNVELYIIPLYIML